MSSDLHEGSVADDSALVSIADGTPRSGYEVWDASLRL
jgi:hypothetical protein